MLRTTLRRLGLRGRPTRSRTVRARLSARPRLELLEARVVPASPLMIRAPYTPYAEPRIVASLPQQDPDHSQGLSYAIANNSRGDSITAWVSQPVPHDQVLPGNGLFYTTMDRFGTVNSSVFLEGLDYNPYDDGYTSDLTGDVSVAVAPCGPYSTVAPYRPFAIAYVRDEAFYSDPTMPPDRATETLYVRRFDAYGVPLPGGPTAVAQVVLTDAPPGTHYSIHDVKIGADHCGGYTVSWLNDTQVDPNDPVHGWRSIDLDVTRVGSTAPPTVVATSYLDTGPTGAFSDWAGDMVWFPDLATNPCGQSVVVWANLVKPDVYYYSAYLQTEHIYAQRLDRTAALLGPRLTVSQHADSYEASPVPTVAMAQNDSGAFVVSWCYAPDYGPPIPLPAPRGIYARLYNGAGPAGDEFMVVPSPNTSGEGPPNQYPPQVWYYDSHPDHPVGMDAAGNFVVGWSDGTSDNSHSRLRVQAYRADGTPRGDPFSLVETWNMFPNSVGPGFTLAMDADGDLVAAWGNPDDVPGLWRSVLARRFLRADFLVQNGETQRSTVEFLSITFNPGTVDLAALAAGGRLRLTRYDLTGYGPGTPVSLAGVVSVSGNTVTFDFGPGGLPDGYYVLEADLDGDGVFESSWRFYRKYGDMDGTGLNNYPGLMPGLILNG
jgi:hypothetical protein